MRESLSTIDAWLSEGLGIGRAVVVRTYGSAPRREGSTLLLSTDGRIAGSVSGGCVEGATVTAIEAARASGRQRLVRFGVSDEQAWAVGLACGGTIDVLVQPAIPLTVLEAARDMATTRAVVTWLPGVDESSPLEEPIVVAEAVSAVASEVAQAAQPAILQGRSSTIEVAGRSAFIEVFAVRPRLVIVGGVPVGQALARLAGELGHEVIVVDPRASFVTTERFPQADSIIVGWPDEVADTIGLGPADAVAVLSHDPKVDEPAIMEALRRGCRYVGAIGSRTTQAARRERLHELGLDVDQVARLHGPIGLDLGGRAPAETALAILAEIVAERYGGSAAPMRARGPRG